MREPSLSREPSTDLKPLSPWDPPLGVDIDPSPTGIHTTDPQGDRRARRHKIAKYHLTALLVEPLVAPVSEEIANQG